MNCFGCLNPKRLPSVVFFDEDGERVILCTDCFEQFKGICLRNAKPIPKFYGGQRWVRQ
jgi:hypothetical protein